MLLDSAGSALKLSPQTLQQQTLSPPTRSSGGIRADIDLSSFSSFLLLLFRGGTSVSACPSCPPWTGGRENVFHLHVLVRPRIMIDDRGFVCRGKREGDRAWPNVVAGSGIRTARRVARDSARTCLRSPSCLPRASAPFLRSSAHREAYASRE